MFSFCKAALAGATFSLGVAAHALPAQSATVSAVSQVPNVSGFSIDFTDTNGNRLFDLSELASFSGVTRTGFAGGTFDILRAIPAIFGVSTAGSLPGTFPPSPQSIVFGQSGQPGGLFAGDASNWSFTVAGLPAAVPLPASLPLMALASGALLAVRRRRT